ncbi:MAG: plasmid pRiA4b ORF-3 family protein [Pseudonocardia sp.]|nr:plasmid pRiA4b ORF-3 family protein [Pseudonocardia sp.]
MRTTRLSITMRDVNPTVLRVVDVPTACTLAELHYLLQAALGWTDSHLHEFEAGELHYGIPSGDGPPVRDETAAGLRELPEKFVYIYDYGDRWTHDIAVLGPGDEQPGCRYGEGPCPPEDCGGPGGYVELQKALADPEHVDHEQMKEWADTPTDFDQNATDLLVRQTVGAVPATVRLVLDLAQGGVRLTPGGRLPRVFVRQVQQRHPEWARSEQPASLEEDLAPLAAMHDVLRGVGLLRLVRGVVQPIHIASDDLQVVRRLRSWFHPGKFDSALTELAVAVLAHCGPLSADEMAARIYPLLGDGWVNQDGRPIDERDVWFALHRVSSVARALDLVDTDRETFSAGPSARWLLPNATALAHLWDRDPARGPSAGSSRAYEGSIIR